MMSRKPAVVMKAVLAPLRSISALVASVVPWMKTPMSCGFSPEAARTALMPSMTPSSGAWVVVSTLPLQRFDPSSSTMSVKVPPMSAASFAWFAMRIG